MNVCISPTVLILAQADPAVPPSYFSWLVGSLGLFGLLLVPLSFGIFVGACLTVFLTRRPAVIAAYLVFVPLPLLLGCFGTIRSIIAMFSIFALSDAKIRGAEVVGGLTEALLLLWAGFLGTFPAYFVTALGLFVRTLFAGKLVNSTVRD